MKNTLKSNIKKLTEWIKLKKENSCVWITNWLYKHVLISEKLKQFYTWKKFCSLVKLVFIVGLVVSAIFFAQKEINDFVREYLNEYLTIIYQLLDSNTNLYLVVLILLGWFSCLSLKKQWKNRDISLYRMALLLFVGYAILNSVELRWVYVESHFLNLTWFIGGYACISFCLELGKMIRFNFRLLIEEERDDAFSLSAKEKQMQDIEMEPYIWSLIGNIRKIDVSEESYAIGITSEWGGGKTTFLNQLKKELQKEVKDSIIISFNPWKSPNKAAIVKDFFLTLQDTLGPYYRNFNNLLNRYANLLADANDDKAITKFIRSLLKKESESLSYLQEKIESILDKIDCPIYVFIDDLDRLDKNEIFEVLKLIRNSASFKRIVYFAAYDRNYLVKTLEKKDVAPADQYIKKIFPLELVLPAFEDHVLPFYLLEELRRLNKDVSFLLLEEEIMRKNPKTQTYYINDYLKTFRDVRNFATSFSTNVMSFLRCWGNISFNDIFWLEVIRYSKFSLYMTLRDHPTGFLVEDEKEKDKIYKIRDGITDSYILQTLELIFAREDKARQENSINNPDHYGSYFSYRLTYSIAIEEFNDIAFRADEDVMKCWLKAKLTESAIHYSSVVRLMQKIVCKDHNPKECLRFIHFICFSLKYLHYGSRWEHIYLLKSILAIGKFNFQLNKKEKLEKEFIETLRKEIDSYLADECIIVVSHLGWIYAATERVNGEESIETATFISNDTIRKLANMIFEHVIDPKSVPISDILGNGTKLSRLLRATTVLDKFEFIDNRPRYYHVNLLIDSLIEAYAFDKASHNYQEFFDTFNSKNRIDTCDKDAMRNARVNYIKVIRYFGTIEQYKKFLDQCFVIPKEEKEAYYKRCRFDELKNEQLDIDIRHID